MLNDDEVIFGIMLPFALYVGIASKFRDLPGKVLYSLSNPEFVVFELMKKNSGVFEKFYKINANRDSERLIEEFGRKNKLLKKGGEVDIDRAARRILKDWQFGKIKI